MLSFVGFADSRVVYGYYQFFLSVAIILSSLNNGLMAVPDSPACFLGWSFLL
jgi:hypothetical protein